MDCYFQRSNLESWQNSFATQENSKKVKKIKKIRWSLKIVKFEEDYTRRRKKQLDFMEKNLQAFLLQRRLENTLKAKKLIKNWIYNPIKCFYSFIVEGRKYLFYLHVFFWVKKFFSKLKTSRELIIFLENKNLVFFCHEDFWEFFFGSIRGLYVLTLPQIIHVEFFAPTILKFVYLKLCYETLIPKFWQDSTLILKKAFVFLGFEFFYNGLEAIFSFLVSLVFLIILITFFIQFLDFMRKIIFWSYQ